MQEDLIYVIQFTVQNFLSIWPYLLLSIPLAVAVRVSNASQYIRRAFVGRPIVAITLATLVGAFSPFCSCSVVPIIASLLIAGVPIGPVMAFWIASPTMDPEIFFLSVSVLGWELAIVRVIATLILSFTAGILTQSLDDAGFFESGILRKKKRDTNWSWKQLAQAIIYPVTKMLSTLRVASSSTSLDMSHDVAFAVQMIPTIEGTTCSVQSDSCACDSSCNTSQDDSCSTCNTETESIERSLMTRILRETWEATSMVIKFIAIAFILEALILLYIPQDAIVAFVGQDNPFAIGLAALVGIPMYTSNLTAMPLVGGLLQQGMLPGAALAFLIAGPVTTLPAMSAVFGIAKPRVFAIYLGISLLGAVVLGYGYQMLLL